MTHSRPRSAGLLVVANRTCPCPVLLDEVARRVSDAPIDVLVVVPALNSRLRHWMSDVDGARRAAEERLQACLDRLKAAGISARGEIGDGDPMQAIADALSIFAADEIIIATHPEERSHWLAHDLVVRARARFDQPVLHIVVDVAGNDEYVAVDETARVATSTSVPAPTLTAS